MPEASIGHFPDVGSSYFLSRLPGHFGEYLGLTGARIDGTEMLTCGLATHFVLSKDLQLLENALCEVISSDNATISALINKFTHKAHLKQETFFKRLEFINKCFSKTTVEEILLSLEKEMANGADIWIVKALNSMKSASPTSLKITLRSIREGRKQDLRQCLIREYIISCHIMRRTVNNDFYEGARAMLLDKDKKPKWMPSELDQVNEEMVNRVFTEVDDDEWVPMELPDRLNATNIAKSNL
ncbi:unnamed protein product [Ilex paraguariensis]|uniref:3-hydroxyisobutyryl-CoA hydrolase n=1 Tax=Ilex paraguariensis TaxID=185542 RepID=A0ABC8REK2_9AQUA